MQQSNYPYQTGQQFPTWYNQPYMSQSISSQQQFSRPQHLSTPSNLSNFHTSIINKNPKTISSSELNNFLNHQTKEFKSLNERNQQQQLPNLIDIVMLLIRVEKPTLISVAQNDFFSLLQTAFINILRQWRRLSSLSDRESFMFRKVTKLIKKLHKVTRDIKQLPSWLSDSTLLEIISDCLLDIGTLGKFLNEKNKREFKHFIRLIDTYINYQKRLNDEDDSDKDKLVELLDPILQCLTSKYYIDTFTRLQIDLKSMTRIQKFFLLKCPSFLISYTGSRLEKSMNSFLSTMLPQYVTILDRLVSSASSWKRAVTGAVLHLLEIINNGANQSQTRAKLISGHLPLINHVLKLVDEPTFYNNLSETLSNIETIFMNTAISFLVNMITEPAILAHIKQRQAAPIFLRLTSCQYEPLVLNVYTLLAYTTHEEDIKAMQNPGRLLSTIVKSLKTTLVRTPEDESHKEQLLETLKGLVQHDQLKDEVVKQNILPFLLECANKMTDKALIIILEVLWALTFHEEIAPTLRSNTDFLSKIQTMSKDNSNEALKKAADGLVWKLIREPAFLEKVAIQEAEKSEEGRMKIITEEIINAQGEKELVTTVKQVAGAAGERLFEYDIMISYCHADQDLIIKLHKFLVGEGYKIWIDLDNMYGPAMSAMADAVENSEFVIMCMSDSYKQSTYCQAEAEYAFNCKRRLLPLIVRPGYKPDGWLGFMIGSRIYVDFGRYDFEIACEKLLTEINLQRKRPPPSKTIQIHQHEIPNVTALGKQKTSSLPRDKSPVADVNKVLSKYITRNPMSTFMRKYIHEWTPSDVLDFLLTQRLTELMPLCDTMDGPALIQLYKMCIRRSSRVYTVLNDDLKSSYKIKLPFAIYIRFLSAMEQRLNLFRLVASPTRLDVPFKTITSAPAQYMSYTPSKPVNNDSPPYTSYPNKPYDLIFTSEAPALSVLRAVERYGLHFQKNRIYSNSKLNSILENLV